MPPAVSPAPDVEEVTASSARVAHECQTWRLLPDNSSSASEIRVKRREGVKKEKAPLFDFSWHFLDFSRQINSSYKAAFISVPAIVVFFFCFFSDNKPKAELEKKLVKECLRVLIVSAS